MFVPTVVVLVVPEAFGYEPLLVPQVQVAPDDVTVIVVVPVATVDPLVGERVGAAGAAALT